MKKINYKIHYYAALMSMWAYWNRIVIKKGKMIFDLDKSDISKKQERRVRYYMNKQHFKNVRFLKKRGITTEILCAMKGGVAYIAYRGTHNWKGWLINLKIRLVYSFMGLVHRGYLTTTVTSIIGVNGVIQYLKDYRPKKVIICGHSKGAAQCTIAFDYIKTFFKEFNVVMGVNFGCPRIMDGSSARAFDRKYKKIFFRYVNNNDVVCRVPPGLRYRHVGTMLYINSNGDIRRLIGWWSLLIDRIKGRFKGFGDGMPDGLMDHFPIAYISAIKKKI